MEIFIHRKPRADETISSGEFWSELDVRSFPVRKVKNLESVERSIQNILKTSFGERFFNIDFGSGISSTLFEPLDSTTALSYRNAVISAIEKWEPRVEVNSSKTRLISDSNSGDIYLELVYRLVGGESYNNYTSTFRL